MVPDARGRTTCDIGLGHTDEMRFSSQPRKSHRRRRHAALSARAKGANAELSAPFAWGGAGVSKNVEKGGSELKQRVYEPWPAY